MSHQKCQALKTLSGDINTRSLLGKRSVLQSQLTGKLSGQSTPTGWVWGFKLPEKNEHKIILNGTFI